MTGVVRASGNGEPIQYATVEAGGGHTAVADVAGRFVLVGVSDRRVVLTASAIGYRQDSVVVTVPRSEPVVLFLEAAPVLLGALSADARAADPAGPSAASSRLSIRRAYP